MITLCSMWDSAYHSKGKALIASLEQWEPDYSLFVLCLDDEVWKYFAGNRRHPKVTPIRLDEIETIELRSLKQERSWAEYVWTLTPSITAYCLNIPENKSIAYIDADCYLFSYLTPLYAEVGEANIAIIPHRWTPKYTERLRPNGIYNVGWVYFTRDGAECLDNWRRQCIERCDLNVGCADQGYLDDWPERWGAHVVKHLGANLAPWSQEQYNYQRIDDHLFIYDGRRNDPLLFYHFHEFIPGKRRTNYPLHPMVAHHVYLSYEAQFEKA